MVDTISRLNMKYDAITDSERYAAPLHEWARLGYLRGFVGMQADLGPKGEVSLPSAAFHEVAFAAIYVPPGDADEIAARTAYVEAVEANLMRIQSSVIEEHYAKASRGWITDLIIGLVTIMIFLTSWWCLGIDHPLTLAILVLTTLKTIIVQIIVRKKIVRTMKAFAAKTSDVRMPWSLTPEAA